MSSGSFNWVWTILKNKRFPKDKLYGKSRNVIMIAINSVLSCIRSKKLAVFFPKQMTDYSHFKFTGDA